MFKTFINAFKVKDVRRKIFYVLMMLVVIRLGSQMPVPGVNTSFFANYFANNTNEAFSFLNAFTGGGFDRFSIFALSITPYITSSIIIQLLTIAIPRLEEMQRDGEEGRKKMTAITRYVTVGLALFESVLLLRSARPAWIRLTMAATMLTAVDTAPRMISTEISGVMNLLPTPC